MYDRLLLEGAQDLVRLHLEYPALFLATFFEGSAIPFPGGILLAISGFLITKGIFDLFSATWLSVSGYVLGALIPYWLGKKGGRPLIVRLARFLKLSDKTLDTAEQWFNRHGPIVVCLTRPFFVGNYISFIAGMSKMRLAPFIFYTGFGILPWAFVHLYIGMILGQQWQEAIQIINRYSIYATFAAVLAALLFIFKRRIAKFLYGNFKRLSKKAV